MGVSASRPAKRWPLARYFQLASQLKGKARVGVVYDSPDAFGGDTYFRNELAKVATLYPTPDLPSLMALLPQARCYVGSDSGVKHLAIALGVRTLTLFGPESVGEWHCYDPKIHPYIQYELKCRSNDSGTPEFAWCGAHHARIVPTRA